MNEQEDDHQRRRTKTMHGVDNGNDGNDGSVDNGNDGGVYEGNNGRVDAY